MTDLPREEEVLYVLENCYREKVAERDYRLVEQGFDIGIPRTVQNNVEALGDRPALVKAVTEVCDKYGGDVYGSLVELLHDPEFQELAGISGPALVVEQEVEDQETGEHASIRYFADGTGIGFEVESEESEEFAREVVEAISDPVETGMVRLH